MKIMPRRFLCLALPLALVPLNLPAAPRPASPRPAAGRRTHITPGFDYSLAVARTMMHRFPRASRLPWGYAPALVLYGMDRTWLRTHDPRLLPYIESWAKSHINARGQINKKITALDFIMPGQVMLALWQQTHDPRYKIAAAHLRAKFNSWPTTSDGGYWHAYGRRHQLWLDGTFMMLPFLVRYGALFHDRAWCDATAARQLLIYARHTNDPKTGLLFHAYDESGKSKWANPVTHHSSQFWGRSIGWYAMALIITLHHLPQNDPRRPRLLALVRQLAGAFRRYQDARSGLWYQVVNRGDLPQNWLETSASCMYTYFLFAAVQRGYIGRGYLPVARKAYRGILARMLPGHDGRIHIPDICVGTDVGNLRFYLNRPRKTDDFHGVGAFLIMNEWVLRHRTLLGH